MRKVLVECTSMMLERLRSLIRVFFHLPDALGEVAGCLGGEVPGLGRKPRPKVLGLVAKLAKKEQCTTSVKCGLHTLMCSLIIRMYIHTHICALARYTFLYKILYTYGCMDVMRPLAIDAIFGFPAVRSFHASENISESRILLGFQGKCPSLMRDKDRVGGPVSRGTEGCWRHTSPSLSPNSPRPLFHCSVTLSVSKSAWLSPRSFRRFCVLQNM